jgi:hypothetical protein
MPSLHIRPRRAGPGSTPAAFSGVIQNLTMQDRGRRIWFPAGRWRNATRRPSRLRSRMSE